MKPRIAIAVTLILTVYQFIRLVVFINVYGGLEHDGGWMLSISRSLAERGEYTTMVSTIVDPSVRGAVNVDQKFDVQADDGRIWFFTGNGIGPASIVPDALVLKILGTDFWALHVGPLIFYTLFLLLSALLLYQLAGLGAIVLFHAFLFFYPHISIFLGYEAMGEVPAMVYALWAYLAFASMTAVYGQPIAKRKFWPWLSPFLVGIIAGLAINAKLITLWSVSGIFLWLAVKWLSNKRDRLKYLREGLYLSGGTALPLILWELVQLIVLTRLAGFDLYRQNAWQRLKFILDDGSGVGLRIYSGTEFFWDKFFLLQEVTHPQRWVVAIIFSFILIGGLVWLWRWRNEPRRQNLLALLWLGWLVNTIWFVSLAKTGWPRHFWFGLVLAVLLLCTLAVAWVKEGLSQLKSQGLSMNSGLLKTRSLTAGGALLALIGWGFISQPHVWGFFVPDEIVPYWQEKQIHSKYGASLPWIIIPRETQTEVVNYIKQMPPEAHIYYPGQHKAAEIPPQTGRMQYPFSRLQFMMPHPADIVLISPSIISPWKAPNQRQDLLALVERECPQPALKNDYYMICPIADNQPNSSPK